MTAAPEQADLRARLVALYGLAKSRADVLLLPLLLVATLFYSNRPTYGVYAYGLVAGCGLLLPALGIVLVHRTNRIINFSQVVVAATAATLMTVLTRDFPKGGKHYGYFPLARLVSTLCQPCVTTIPADQTHGEAFELSGFAYQAMYWSAAVLAVVLAVGLSLVVFLAARRLRQAPRLLVAVTTIFLAEAFAGLRNLLPTWLTSAPQHEHPQTLLAVAPPFRWEVTLGSTTFDTAAMLTLVGSGVVTALLCVYLLRSRSGLAIRAAAESEARAGTLGVDAGTMSLRVWVWAGLLSGTAGVMLAMQVGSPLTQGSSLSILVLVRVLVVATIARLSSVPVAIVSALALGVFEQVTQAAFGTTEVLDASLLAVIGAALLVQRRVDSRAERELQGTWASDREIRPVPHELRQLPAVRTAQRVGAVVLALLLAGLPWVLSEGQAYLASVALVYAMIGLSLLVLTGWSGQISLGQFALAAIGAYAGVVSGLPFLLALPTGAAAGAVVAVLLGVPALRLRGFQLAAVTLAFAVTTTSLLLSRSYLGSHLPDSIGRPAFAGVSFDDQRLWYYVCLFFLVLVALAVLGMRRSSTARTLVAARDNEQLAQSFAVNVLRARLTAFAVSGAIAGFAGVLYASGQRSIGQDDFPAELSVTLFLATVLGGFGGLAGPLLGAAYFGLLTITGVAEGKAFLAGGLGGALLLCWIGGGLNQALTKLRDALLRRLADRHNIVVPSLVADVRPGDVSRRASIQPRLRAGGGTAFVPRRYALPDQWAADPNARPEVSALAGSVLAGPRD